VGPVRATRVLAAILVLVLAAACGSRSPAGAGPAVTATATATPTAAASPTGVATETTLRARAADAVSALRDKDFAKLAAAAHPDKGVRFSPYAFVNLQRDVVLPAATLGQGFAHRQRYLWGHTDGQGLPMDWMLEEYYTRHLWNKDYSKAPTVVLDKRTGMGNATDNSAQAYPGARIVEYHQPSTDPNTTLDWGSLRLVFEERAGAWLLVGVISDRWTI
jgi:hypothetical protein